MRLLCSRCAGLAAYCVLAASLAENDTLFATDASGKGIVGACQLDTTNKAVGGSYVQVGYGNVSLAGSGALRLRA